MNPAPKALQIVGLGMSTLDILVRSRQLPTWEAGAALDELGLDGGGPAGTAIVAAARLGARTGMITTTGSDETAGLKMRLLQQYGVDTSRCVVRPGPEPQLVLVCIQSQTGERVFSGTPRTGSSPVLPDDLDREYITQAEYLHLDGFFLPASLQAARWMHAAGKKVSLDAAKTNGSVPESLRELVKECDLLICGAGFCTALTGISEVRTAAREILSLGPGVVVETQGERGSITVTREDEFHTPAYAVDVVDTTGAGDVFHGAYLVGLLKGWEARRIAQFASAVAAFKCMRLGGRRGIPCDEEVISFLANHQPKT
ncbi:MAG TPA: PfkB family carbohydrate kinase [Anaerolinea sp.]|nr:PfkB family carbohydrate kinase [Anaerolinea sp.]